MTDGVNPRRNRVESLRSTNVLSTLTMSQAAEIGRDRDSHAHGLRDRALLGTLAYTFARIGAVVRLKVEDYYPSGKRFLLRFKEKGGFHYHWNQNVR
jgi:site-specific recombinase XerD